jgi:hypothetical protein
MTRGSKDREVMGWCRTSTFNSGNRGEHPECATKKRRFAPRVDSLGSNGADVGRGGPSGMFVYQRTSEPEPDEGKNMSAPPPPASSVGQAGVWT